MGNYCIIFLRLFFIQLYQAVTFFLLITKLLLLLATYVCRKRNTKASWENCWPVGLCRGGATAFGWIPISQNVHLCHFNYSLWQITKNCSTVVCYLEYIYIKVHIFWIKEQLRVQNPTFIQIQCSFLFFLPFSRHDHTMQICTPVNGEIEASNR